MEQPCGNILSQCVVTGQFKCVDVFSKPSEDGEVKRNVSFEISKI